MARRFEGFSNAAMDRLVAYGWPGNIRELANEIERTAALANPGGTIRPEDLSEHVRGGAAPVLLGGGEQPLALTTDAEAPIEQWDLNLSVDRLKRIMLIRAIRAEGSKSGAAERLGIPRQSLQKMVKRLAISDAELQGATAGGDE
jgi:transcriptional regulator with PAS, ATPase and Fis domain